MSAAKSDCQSLVDEWLKFAIQMLEEHGEFIPYGCAMDLTGQIGSYSTDTGDEFPKSQEVIHYLKAGFRSQKENLKCTAIFFDVVIRNPEKTDAIAIYLDHKDDYSNIVCFPYVINNSVVELGQPSLNAGSNDIFGETN